METVKEMMERHRQELRDLQTSCPHKDVEILDEKGVLGAERTITIRCITCGEPIIGWSKGYTAGSVNYAKGFVREGNQ